MGTLKFALCAALAVFPSPFKIWVYRALFGYRIGRGVRIGLSPFVGVKQCCIGDGTRIGSFNLFFRVDDLEIGAEVRIGFLNLFRGGRKICIGDYCSILRQNTVNSILDPDFIVPVDSTFSLGTGAVVAASHWLDFSAGIAIGDHVIVGGRNSSFWTHNRQRGRPISVGHHAYLGSGVLLAPGVEVPPLCVVALGAVLTGRYDTPRTLIGGNPAAAVRSLTEGELYLVTHKTRQDIPDDIAASHLPADVLSESPTEVRRDGDLRLDMKLE